MYEIKKGIDKPMNKSGVKKYPFEDMQVGDMFFVPSTSFDKTQGSIRSSARKYLKQGKKFAILKHTLDNVVGVGVWRED